MTNPEIPGAGSQENSPHYPVQSPSTQQGTSAPTQTLSPPPMKTKKSLNVLGLIALITAVLGFIFACIPGALIIGWIFLPIAFVLALVSLFLRDKAKWMGIAALITSIVGTIVGVAVFFSAVATSFDDAFSSGETTVVEPTEGTAANDDAAEKKPAADGGTRENPYPIGSTIESDDWRVIVNSVTLAATDDVVAANEFNEPPADGSQYMLIGYSASYIGDDPEGQLPAFVSIEYVTASGNTVNGLENSVVAPDPIDTMSTLYTDATATGNMAIEVPSDKADQGVLVIRPGMLGDKVFVAVK